MSPTYEYRKLYADLVDAAGEVLVLYVHQVCFAGVWSTRASVERYAADGQRHLVHGAGPSALLDAGAGVGALPTRLTLDDGTAFTLTFEPILGGWAPSVPPPVPALGWTVLTVRSEANASMGGRSWRGVGYADLVRITRPTRLIGLRGLRWGHVHFRHRTLVFEHVTTVDGRTWDTGVDWATGESAPRELAGPNAVDADGAGVVPTAGGEMVLRPSRVLHAGDAFDAERVPRAFDRAACRVFGGPTVESRWVGEGRLGDEVAPALYEVVGFG